MRLCIVNFALASMQAHMMLEASAGLASITQHRHHVHGNTTACVADRQEGQMAAAAVQGGPNAQACHITGVWFPGPLAGLVVCVAQPPVRAGSASP